jgi:hypothetical protein
MKTRFIYSLLFPACIYILVTSCEPFCTEGNGIIKSEQRLVAEFTGVENSTSFDVDITADTVFSVEVTADENILPLINTSVRGNTLVIETNYNNCINNATVNIDIHMPVLEYLELNGSGNVDAYNFFSSDMEVRNSGSGNIDMVDISVINTIELKLSGSGKISVTGKAREGDYSLSGSGDIKARDILVDDCYVNNSGSGDIECFAYLLLDATVSGSGDILYFGNPEQVVPHDSGSGDIRHIN